MATRQWTEISKGAFLGMLCQPNMVIKPPQGSTWYIVLGNMFGEDVLVWPAKCYWCGQQLFEISPDLSGAQQLLVVYCPSTWAAATFEWRSPWSQVLHGDIKPADAIAHPRISMCVAMQPAPLIEIAARSAFPNLSLAQLGTLARFMGVKFTQEDSLWSKLNLLLMQVFPNMNGEEVERVLAQRLTPPCDLGDFILQESFEDFIDQKDLKAFHDQKKTAESSMQSAASVRKEWLQFKALRVALRAGGGNRGKVKKKFVNFGGAPFPDKFPGTDMSSDEAQRFCPAPLRVYRDAVNMRWQIHIPSVASRSRAFSVYGLALALRLVLQWAWSERLLRGGMPIDACPMSDLFLPESEAPVAAVGAAASSSTSGAAR